MSFPQIDRDPMSPNARNVLIAGGVVLLHAASIRLRLNDSAQARALLEQALACPLRLSPSDRELANKTAAALR